ncbi:DUF3040 domain-containing protein [Actinomadura sp. KC06]|nr:DUF3040 domain-containing protein [Actinomadura sp. KC06]
MRRTFGSERWGRGSTCCSAWKTLSPLVGGGFGAGQKASVIPDQVALGAKVMPMELSDYERTVLRQLGSDLDRQDPRLARQLTEFTPLKGDAIASCRPPRVAVAVAAVMLAAVSFMVVAATTLMQAPCPAADGQTAAATGSPSPTHHVSSPADQRTSSSQGAARDSGTRSTAGEHAPSSSPSRC